MPSSFRNPVKIQRDPIVNCVTCVRNPPEKVRKGEFSADSGTQEPSEDWEGTVQCCGGLPVLVVGKLSSTPHSFPLWTDFSNNRGASLVESFLRRREESVSGESSRPELRPSHPRRGRAPECPLPAPALRDRRRGQG